MMKRIGIKNVKHRDLLVEVMYDLSKPQPPQSEEEIMTAKFTLVRNTWSNERKPDIQLHAMADVLAASGDESKHELLKNFELLKLLKEIISGNMMDEELEKNLKARQLEIDELWKRRRKRELDYEQKKDLDRKEHLQARDWLQWKADFGSIAVTAFATLQNVSKSPIFTKDIARDDFPAKLIMQLDRCRDAEKHLTLLKAMGKGQYMSLVASEVAEQQLLMLNIIYNLSLEPENRKILCGCGVAAAVVQVAKAPTVRDTPRYLQCMRIFCNLSLGAGETEVRMVQDMVLGPVVNAVREGHGELLLYAISTVANLAFVEENRDAIVDAGVMIPLTKILKEEGETPAKLKALDAVRNLAAAHADLRFAKIVVDELIEIVRNGAPEERLRALIALRSVTRFEETLQICEEQGVMRQALVLIAHDDIRVRTQAIGLMINVIGMSAVTPMDPDEEDELSDSELFSDDEEGPLSPAKFGEPQVQELTEGLSSSQPADNAAGAPADGSQASGAPADDATRQKPDRPPALDVAALAGGAKWDSLEEDPNRNDELVGADRPLIRANKLLQMRVSPFFRLLTERELEVLALGSEYFILHKGDALVVQGDSCESVYVVIRGIMRVLIGAKGAGKWGMHRITRNQTKASSPTNHSDSPVSLGSPQDRAGEEASSPHSPTIADSPLLDSPVGGKRGGKKGGEKKVGGTFRAGKDTKEVSRLRPGDSANELCVMEGRRSLATLVGMTDESVIMDIKAKQLAEVLLARPEFKDAISSGEMVMMSDIEKVRRVWKHPAMSDEAAEKSNLFRIESSERKAKVQRHLLAIGAQEVFEQNVEQETRILQKTMFQIGLTLLIGGPENKNNPLFLVGEDVIEQLKGIIDCSRHGEDFYGHVYECDKVLLCMRLLAMNDQNKHKFVQNSVIPFVLDLLKDDDQEIVRLATATLLELSFGMQARWLLRPIMGIWNKYVKSSKVEREIAAIPPPLTDAVDIAAPTHLVQVRSLESEPTFGLELHEAAWEGGQQWIERLVEEEGVPADAVDNHGATAMHFAAMNARFEAMSYLMDRDVDINVQDSSGCTPLAWYIMAKNIEFGTDQEVWPEGCKKAIEWMTSQGAVAQMLPMFANTV